MFLLYSILNIGSCSHQCEGCVVTSHQFMWMLMFNKVTGVQHHVLSPSFQPIPSLRLGSLYQSTALKYSHYDTFVYGCLSVSSTLVRRAQQQTIQDLVASIMGLY
ncbi:hypothetical protein L208DRAFT_347726 [Tricholoma matsutake]|nr:hypothetical protein L208DRAFT_347726 [Tricholoma matsutake 945]